MDDIFLRFRKTQPFNIFSLRTIIIVIFLLAAYIYPQNTVEVTSGNTIELLNGNQMEIIGSYSDAGTLTTDNSSTVIFNGTSNSTITKTGGESFTNLIVNQASGTLTLNNNITITGALTINSDSLITGSDTVTLGGTATLTETSRAAVLGYLTTTRTLPQNVNNTFGGIGIEINAVGSAPGVTTVTRVTGVVEKNDTSISIKRYFNILPSTNSGLNAKVVFHYDMSELNGLNEPELKLLGSTDGGKTWVSLGGTVDVSAHTLTINGINSFSRLTLFGSNSIGQISWTKTSGPNNYNIYTLTVGANNILYAGSGGGDIYSTGDEGNTWTQLSNLQNFDVKSLCSDSSGELFAGTSGGGVFKSTDNGANWLQVNGGGNSQISDLRVNAVIALGNNVILAGTYGGISRSTDNGATWNQTSVTDLVNAFTRDMNGNIYAGINGLGPVDAVSISTDDGSSWTSIGLNGYVVNSLMIGLYNKLFAGCFYDYGLFSSTDQGKIWAPPALNNNNILSLTINKSGDLFAGTDVNGVFESMDNGTNWVQQNNNLSDLDILSLAVDNNGILFAGPYAGGVFRAGSAPTAVKNIHPNLPTSYNLSQNYPNPFNPSTIISYQLPVSSKVVLKIYDLLGRDVATLVDDRQHAGNYSVKFNAGNLSSGIYFYRLIAGGFNQVKKLVLLK